MGIDGDLSSIARKGSGSACRSMHGGFVMWKMGKEKDGSDSVAEQIAPSSHWKEMRMLILIVNGCKKTIASSAGMERSVKTSDFLKNLQLDQRVSALRKAILNKDFVTFAEITMKDSNRLHSICLDTYPPIQYLNDTSHYIIQLVHFLNDHFGKPKVAYSFDAGPNACLFLLEENVSLVLSLVNHYLPPLLAETNTGESSYFKGYKVEGGLERSPPPPDVLKAIPLTPLAPGALKGIIHVDVGDGPQILGKEEHLLDDNGLPITS